MIYPFPITFISNSSNLNIMNYRCTRITYVLSSDLPATICKDTNIAQRMASPSIVDNRHPSHPTILIHSVHLYSFYKSHSELYYLLSLSQIDFNGLSSPYCDNPCSDPSPYIVNNRPTPARTKASILFTKDYSQ